VIDSQGNFGTSNTVGGGGQSPMAGLTVGPMVSNAADNWSLNGWFGYGGFGVVTPAGGGTTTVSAGLDSCKRGVIVGELDFAGGVGIPIDVNGGASYTTYEDWRGPLQSAWNSVSGAVGNWRHSVFG
jgi:hypothetical protein